MNSQFLMVTTDFTQSNNPQFSLSKAGFPATTISELSAYNCCLESNKRVRDMMEIFNREPRLPGITLLSNGKFIGMISRERCFEALGRPFGIEIYSKLATIDFYRLLNINPLILEEKTLIQDAVKIALSRNKQEVYDPIIIRLGNNTMQVINMHDLLTAQCELLEKTCQQVEQLSIRDPLTKINNRRGFFDEARPKFESAFGNQLDLSALMIDIDNFKMVNDLYGHFIGDCTIQAVAEECQKALRQTDLIGRFGGEEFIVVLPDTSLDAACAVAERIRSRIEELVIYVEGFQVSVTVSIGVSQLGDARGSFDELLTQADQAMYSAKWAGRNQVLVWDALLGHKVRKDLSTRNEDNKLRRGKKYRKTTDAARIYDETIEGWARALELRDKEAKGHAQRVSTMTVELARRIGVTDMSLVDIRRGALLHDIGKIAIPDGILFKSTPLSEAEWDVMRKHPIYAFELLSPITFLQNALDIPYCHHEHWDGSGYPRGLNREEIPIAARAFTIVDVWDALSTNRCYRPAWEYEAVVEYLLGESGHLLDPAIVPIFIKMLDEIGQNNHYLTEILDRGNFREIKDLDHSCKQNKGKGMKKC